MREMTMKGLLLGLMLAVFSTAASAQSHWLSEFLDRYKPPKVDPAAAVMPQISSQPWQPMVQQGTLPISVNDIIQLMLARNLDVAVDRFSPMANQYLMQTLFQPFEPTLNLSAQMMRSTTPTASQLQGAASLSQLSHQYSVSYLRTFQAGTSVSVNLQMNRNSSNSLFSTFNPSYYGNLTYSLSQPLLRNHGRDINGWQIRIARNNLNVSEINFELQTIDLVTAAQQLYWDLVYQRDDIKVHKEALDLAEKTLSDNRRQVEIGTMARIEVVQAESEVAQRQEQMVTTTYAADQTQDRVKTLITNLGDPALVLARINPIDSPRRPDPNDIMPIEEAIKSALESRPELRQLDLQLKNGDINLQYTRNQLLPNLTVGASYTQSGVGGVQTLRSQLGDSTIQSVVRGGLSDAFGQMFGYSFTGYGAGFNLSIPLSNKAEKAQYARALTDKQTVQATRARLVQQIALDVRNAQSQVEMNRARITAAERALELANLQLQAEQKKFQLGTSQLRFVLEEQRTVSLAQTDQIQALVNYAKSLVDYDRAVGRTLRKNNIEIEKQMQVAGLVE
jgi:outer membrane protein